MGNVEAIFYLSNEVPKPKINGIKSGYVPHHKFKNIEYLISGFHKYSDDSFHYPGESIFTIITFASWEYIKDQIRVNDEFEVREMDRVVGYGKVTKIIS